jgi:hypothetical protein
MKTITINENLKSQLTSTRNISVFRFVQLLLLAGLLLTAASCKKEDDPNLVFKATMNGASEVPQNASTATGSATLTFNEDTKIFTVVVTFTGVTATNGHIHKGAVGVSGGPVYPFAAPYVSPINYTSVALDATQEADLKAGLYYVNIHSAAYSGGEIRGQLELETK